MRVRLIDLLDAAFRHKSWMHDKLGRQWLIWIIIDIPLKLIRPCHNKNRDSETSVRTRLGNIFHFSNCARDWIPFFHLTLRKANITIIVADGISIMVIFFHCIIHPGLADARALDGLT